jgi:hypothetical protein
MRLPLIVLVLVLCAVPVCKALQLGASNKPRLARFSRLQNLGMGSEDTDATDPEIVVQQESLVEEKEQQKDSSKIMVLGLNIKDPQDIISAVLITLIAYNTLDLAAYYLGKLINK